MRSLVFAMMLLVTSMCYGDIRTYDSKGRYSGRISESYRGYRMYDSRGAYSGSAYRYGNSYRTYDGRGRYNGSFRVNGK
jgi:tRNA splicing endonuclease